MKMAVISSPRELPLHYKKQALQIQRRNRTPRQRIQKFSKCSLDTTSYLQTYFERELKKCQQKDAKTWPRCSEQFPPLVYKSPENQSTQNIRLKNIPNRIRSATGLIVRPETTCDRQQAMKDSKMCRHFCELLGPTLCCDCTERRERVEGIKECEKPPSLDRLDHDPFSAFITTHYGKEFGYDYDSDEEILVNELSDNEEQWSEGVGSPSRRARSAVTVNRYTLSPSPPPGDSGYSSRVSYIRSLTRAQSSSLFRSIPATPTSPFMREKTASRIRERRLRFNSGDKAHRDEPQNPLFSIDSTIAETLGRLEERVELKGLLTRGGERPSSVKPATSKVGPVLMELKLINFTQYDKLGYKPSDIGLQLKLEEQKSLPVTLTVNVPD